MIIIPIKKWCGYTRDGQQRSGGYYLMMFCGPGHYRGTGRERLYAAVRIVRLRQLGHWMMGDIRIGGFLFGVSGAIGNDGLPMNYRYTAIEKDGHVRRASHHDMTKREVAVLVRDFLTLVPKDIAEKYWTNNGHNTVDGEAAVVLKKWAQDNLKVLQRTKTKPRGV